MAYHHHIEGGRRLALVTFRGPLDGAEIAAATERLYANPLWEYGSDAIWDFRMIRGLHLNVGHLPALVELDRRFAAVAGPGIDLLVTAKELHHGLARLHAHLSRKGPRTVIACRSMEEAEETLARTRASVVRPGAAA